MLSVYSGCEGTHVAQRLLDLAYFAVGSSPGPARRRVFPTPHAPGERGSDREGRDSYEEDPPRG